MNRQVTPKQKSTWMIFWFCLLITSIGSAQSKDFLEAKNLYLVGNYYESDRIFQTLINQENVPTNYYLAYIDLLIDWQEFHKVDSLLQLLNNNQLARDSNSINYTEYLLQLSHLKIEQKAYTLAEQLLTKLENETHLKNTPFKLEALTLLGELYLEIDKLDDSKKYLEQAEGLYTKCCSSNENLLAIIYNHQSRLYLEKEDYDLAEKFIKKALIIENKKGAEHPDYLRTYYNKGVLSFQLGQFDEAEEVFTKIESTYKKIYSNKQRYIELLGQLGILAEETGYYQKASDYYKLACGYFKNNNLTSYIRYANRFAILLEEKLGQDSIAIKIYKDAIKVCTDGKGKDNLDYASLANNLAEYYEENNQLKKADSLYQEAKTILKKIVGKYDYGYASVIFNLAYLQKKLGNLDLAEQYFLEVAEIDSVTIGVHHPDYIDYTLMTLANFYDLKDEEEKASNYYHKANQGKLDLMNYYYATFDEQTRLNFLKEAENNFDEYFSFLYRRKSQMNSFTAAQNINLQIKGLALDYTQNNRDRIFETKDTLLQVQYSKYREERKKLGLYYALSAEQQQAQGIDLDKQKEKVTQLEKKLTRWINDFDDKQSFEQEIAFTSLVQKLNLREVTIDFIKFNYYNKEEKRDTIYYYALLTQKNAVTPKFIPLCTQKQLKALLKLSNQYGAGYTKYPEIGQKIYELIWQPLEPYLKDIKTIHLSPTGLLHKVAFGGLPYKNGQLLDQYQLNYYGNLRDFINNKSVEIPKNIALVGGAYFDIDSTDLVQLAAEAEEFAFVKLDSIALTTSIASVSRAIASDSTRNAVEFNYLPGTKKEVEQLATSFKAAAWQTVTYTGAQASEDNIKILNGDNAPGILHLATHGYFFNPYEKKVGEILSDETMRERIIGAESPLLRSGLVFSGVNHSWKGGKPIAGLEDGVLTAFEIANMELWNTKLVVLSACETGLGDVESAEGVFGLQRAFKAAGVNKLIISLWKIPDVQTAELMQLFYNNYLDGMSLSTALREAQLTMSEKYSPFYWAGFILIE